MTNGSSLDDGSNMFQKIFVPTIFGLVVFIGCVGNVLVIVVVWSNKQMRNTTNILIVSLAIADLFFLVFCVPFTAFTYASTRWPFGEIWCKIVYYLIYVCAYGSVYTLVLMSFDRYLAVVHAVRSLTIRTERNTFIAVAIMWTVILSVNVHTLIGYQYVEYPYNVNDAVENRSTCIYMEIYTDIKKGKIFYACFFLLGYVIPLVLICILYGFMLNRLLYGMVPGGGIQSAESIRSKKRVTKMVVIVVVVFAICWLPNQTVLMISAFKPILAQSSSVFNGLMIASNCLAYMNSCMNPILYAFLSDNFRKSFKKLICCSKPVQSKADNYERTNIGGYRGLELETLNNTRSTQITKSTATTGHTNGNEITTLVNDL